MKKVLTLVICLLLVAFATPVFADLALVDEGNNFGYLYDEDNPNARYYIKDLYKFYVYVVYAVVLRNEHDHFIYVTDQAYYIGKHLYKYEILCGEGLVVIQLYRPMGDGYLFEQDIVLSANDIKIIEDYIEEHGLPEVPEDGFTEMIEF